MSLTRLIAHFSVRTRIIALALIPVVGFLANGISFTGSETEVDSAFDSVKQAAALADAARDFKAGLTIMLMTAREFTERPTEELVQAFRTGHGSSASTLDTIARSVDPSQQKDVEQLKAKLWELQASFDELTQEQRTMGFNDAQGIRAALAGAAAQLQRSVSVDLVWMPEAERSKLVTGLLIMRRADAEYRLHRMQTNWELFFQELKKFNEAFATVDAVGREAQKQQVSERVRTYATTLTQRNRNASNIDRLLSVITDLSEQTLPAADKIIMSARDRANDASASLAASQRRTKHVIVWVGCAV